MKKKIYVFNAVGLDIFDRRHRDLINGTRVIKVQPAGCPKNGTLGHCFIAHADSGHFIGLVLEKSLKGINNEG